MPIEGADIEFKNGELFLATREDDKLYKVDIDNNTFIEMRNLPEDVSGMALYSDDNFIVAHNDSVKFRLRSDTADGQGDSIPVEYNGASFSLQNGDMASALGNCYQIKRTWTAEDECGNKTTHTQTITVVDNYAVEELPEVTSNDNDEDSMSLAGSNEGEAMGVELDFMAYPVPFDRDINVKFNFEFDTDVVIDIHDTRGLLVKSVTLNNVRANSDVKKSFDLSRAGDQLFYITVTTNRGSVTKKAVSSNMKRR